jgi:transposase
VSCTEIEEDPWFAGLDWAYESHQVVLVDAHGTVAGERTFPHGGEGLGAMCDWILTTAGVPPEATGAAVEVPHGPVVETLMERGLQVHAINPKQLDRFRDRFTVAGAKDDRLDGRVLADSLRTDRHCFRPLRPADPVTVELREWSRMVEDLQQERNRLSNRVREQLWRYYPQLLKLTDDAGADWFLALWALVPTPARAARIHQPTIERLLKTYRIRRIGADAALTILRQKPIKVAPGTTEAATAHIRALTVRLKVVNRQIKEAHRQLDTLCTKLADPAETEPGQPPEQRDVTILLSLPGVGRIVVATLLAEAAEPLRERDYHALRSLCGAAPVTRRSGERCVVVMCRATIKDSHPDCRATVMRQACNIRLRTAVYHWARVAIQHDEPSKRRYRELRQRGHSHGRALRTVADRLLAVACAMLRTRTLFDPARARAFKDAA